MMRARLKISRLIPHPTGRAAAWLAAAALLMPAAHAQVLTESPEIVYSGPDAQVLRDKAAQLGNAVAIYEYAHNTIEFSPYHGSRSGSVNTLLGQRGSDVDIASTLIALLRAQGIPARYAVGTVRMPTEQLKNWLGIGNFYAALQVLKDQGIQGVTPATGLGSVDFEHTWVEAFVPFDQYRGINLATPAVDCSQGANFPRCSWVALDASFKQKAYNSLDLDPYNAVSFDYPAYYNAIKNNDPARRDKNPLAILEDQIGGWLRTNYPGQTLEDVANAGQIIELREGLLPASLPYPVVSNIRRYDSVAAHDAAVPAAEPAKWGKRLSISFYMVAPLGNGGTLTVDLGAGSALLAELNTRRLTLSTEFPAPGNVPNVVTRLGGSEIARPLAGSGTIVGYTPRIGDPFTLNVTMDGAPGASAGDPERTISASYTGVIGGYYLLATGGEASNWSQVHRAAGQLLASNDQYKIVFRPGEPGCQADGTNCTPYVDANANGWDASDPKLLENKPALDALTGGLLYVGATQYFAKLREQFERSDRLMRTKTPVIGFLGVVSSVYEAEYIDGTAFSILPGGLLIDMKGITIGGSYRSHESAFNYSNRQFEFQGHISSSLEHETWQELTGYDAVSTVRGIQMALTSGATLLNPKKNTIADTLPDLYSSFDFNSTAPAGFTYTPFTIFATAPTAWAHATNGSGFDTFLGTVSTGIGSLQRSSAPYAYAPSGGLYGWSKCVSDQVARVNASPNGSYSGSTCSGTAFNGSKATILDIISSDWSSYIIPTAIGQDFFDYFDRNKAFNAASQVYRGYPVAIDAYDTLTILGIRNDLQLRDVTRSWVEYTLPSTLVAGCQYRFEVNIRKEYITSSGSLSSLSFEIANRGSFNSIRSCCLTATGCA